MSTAHSAAETIRLPLSLRLLRRLPLPHKLGLLERVYGRQLARHGTVWARTAPGPLWKLDLTNVCQRWILYGDYEGHRQMRWIRRWLRNGDVVVDSGANIGQMLLYFASAADIRILAFEPLPAAREWLLECLERQSGWNVSVLDFGLGATSETLTLQVHGALSTTRLDWYASDALGRIEIQVETLDSTLERTGTASVRLWKLDMEGGEPLAIIGARDSLLSRRIQAVLVESSPESFSQLKDSFGAVGFVLFDLPARGPLRAATGLTHGNLLALPAEHPQAP